MGFELWVSGLSAKHIYQLSHLAAPLYFFLGNICLSRLSPNCIG